MMESANAMKVHRVRETGNRAATVLENSLLKVLIDDHGGMVPELSCPRNGAWMNAHWIPEFRSNSGVPYDETENGSFWKASLLHSIAGNFLCSPNFGSPETIDGVELPAHGWVANKDWQMAGYGIDEGAGAAWLHSSLTSPTASLPLRYTKLDAVFPGMPVHFTSLRIANTSTAGLAVNIGWHNTVGAPFLQAGCRISASAECFASPPAGTEFDTTGRLAMGAEFKGLDAAPLRTGGTCDLRTVTGPTGSTDFICGPVPESARLGWSTVVNPAMGLVYASFFPGPAALDEDEITLRFNAFWMQYGGRNFTPWAAYEGGTDRTFCLGTENISAFFGNGLAQSRSVQSLMGAPTTVIIPGGSVRVLRYGTLLAGYGQNQLDGGVDTLEQNGRELVFVSGNGRNLVRIPADAGFSGLRQLEGVVLRS